MSEDKNKSDKKENKTNLSYNNETHNENLDTTSGSNEENFLKHKAPEEEGLFLEESLPIIEEMEGEIYDSKKNVSNIGSEFLPESGNIYDITPEQVVSTSPDLLLMPGHPQEKIESVDMQTLSFNNDTSDQLSLNTLNEESWDKYDNNINVELSLQNIKYDNTFMPGKTTIAVSIFSLFISYFLICGELYLQYFKNQNRASKFFYSYFLVFLRLFTIWLSLLFSIWSIYILFRAIITSRKLIKLGAFIEFTLTSFETGLVLFISMIVLEAVKKSYFNSIILGVEYQYADKVYLNYWEHCLKIFLNVYLDKFLGVITNIINIYLIFNIFIVLVDANLYFSRYKNKIMSTKPIVKFLRGLDTLNDGFPNKTSLYTTEFEEYSSIIYDKLTDNSILNINHFRLKFGVEKGNDFFKYFNPNFSNNISKKEFVRRHKSLVVHSISLHKSIISNRKSIDNLQTVTNILSLIPISFMVLSYIDSGNEIYSTSIVASSVALGTIFILPLKSVLQDIFYSFFYAFVVRPFDINDIIIIDKKYSRCLELGIFKSAFLTEGRYEIIETKSIGDQMIYTLENTNSVTFTVQKKFKLQAFDKYNELKEMIYEYLKFNPHMFRIQHCVYYLIEENSVMISVEYNCVCRYQELDFANHCSKKFQSKFHDMTESLEMVYA